MRDAQTARYHHHLLILYHLLHFCNEQGFHLNTQYVLHTLVFQVTTLKQALNHRKCIKYQYFHKVINVGNKPVRDTLR